MSETSGGGYERQKLAWPTIAGTPTFVMLASATSKPFPRCDTPDAAEFDEWEWTCPDCGTVWSKHADYWWEPEEVTAPEPWTRHSLYRVSDGALIAEYVTASGRGLSWSPGPDFDPNYPAGYEWRVVEVVGSSTATDSAGNVTHTATWMW